MGWVGGGGGGGDLNRYVFMMFTRLIECQTQFVLSSSARLTESAKGRDGLIYEGKSISNQPIPLPIDRDTHDLHAFFQYMF